MLITRQVLNRKNNRAFVCSHGSQKRAKSPSGGNFVSSVRVHKTIKLPSCESVTQCDFYCFQNRGRDPIFVDICFP